jgi:8-oxo-dGTP pyrophosphatase MutT (NUDIX family)
MDTFMAKDEQKPWDVTRSERGPALPLFQVRFDRVRNPRNGHNMKAVILEADDWVNVVAITPHKKVVVVRQYRFGTRSMTVEIPAGIMEADETPKEAAARELCEETGYAAREWKYLGYVEPNPAFMDNACHNWLAVDASQVQQPNLDVGEDIRVEEMSEEELRREIKAGSLRHSLALVALAQVFELWPDSA